MSNTPLSAPFENLPSGSLRVLQITDTHISADKSHRLAGLDTLNSFQQVVDHAKQRLGKPDIILATGDLVHDASKAGYALLEKRLAQFGVPVYYLPGNHDLTKEMLATCAKQQNSFPFSLQRNDWSLIMLDSSVPGKVGGHLAKQQLLGLERILSTHTDHHSLVCLHHHPRKVGSTWMDKIDVDNPQPFFDIIDKHPQVKGILYGHIHQVFEGEYKGIRLLGSPSTCIQFTPGQNNFGIDDIPPGYRWLVLLPDGTIQSGIERLDSASGSVDLDSKGYI